MTTNLLMVRKTNNQIIKERILKAYYDNPNYCLHCGKTIVVQESQRTRDARVKKFCNHICASTYNNKIRILKKQPKARFIGLSPEDYLAKGLYQNAIKRKGAA